MQAEAGMMVKAEMEALHSWAIRCGTRLLLYAISQRWQHLSGMLTAGLIDTLGCTMDGLSAEVCVESQMWRVK